MSKDEFKISDSKNYHKISGFSEEKKQLGSRFLVSLLGGVIGSAAIVATCIYVPPVNKYISSKFNTGPAITVSTSDSRERDLINLTEYSDTAISVANKVLPSIVGIEIEYTVNSAFMMGSTTGKAMGSGIIISEDGYILTNNHVIDSSSSSSYFYNVSEANKVTVKLYNDETEYSAEIIGSDEITDLAVIKINKDGLQAATLGNSDNTVVGEFAMAIGNPMGMQSSVTCGIISALNRTITAEGTTYTAIQTDAAINSGNSGGALVNSKGEVIGVNTLKLSGNSVEGIGFAIPISQTTNIIEQLIKYKTVKRPYIGIGGGDVDENVAKYYNIPTGVLVKNIEKDSPAEAAGIQVKDIITAINGTKISSMSELNTEKNKCNIGDTIKISITRGTEELEIELKLAEMPAEEK